MSMKRQRGRGRKSNGHQPNRNFESNGPDIKIRGSAVHVYEKYQQLARDAASSGDRIAAESYLQHAEHYFRMMRSQQQYQQRERGEEGGMREAPAPYANGRDEGEDLDLGEYSPQHGGGQPHGAQPFGGPSRDVQPHVSQGGPLDVVDPEAAEQPAPPPRSQEREEGRSRRGRRQRRRYEGGGNGGGEGGEPVAAAPTTSLDGA